MQLDGMPDHVGDDEVVLDLAQHEEHQRHDDRVAHVGEPKPRGAHQRHQGHHRDGHQRTNDGKDLQKADHRRQHEREMDAQERERDQAHRRHEADEDHFGAQVLIQHHVDVAGEGHRFVVRARWEATGQPGA